jgi:hypothetical protein
MLDKRDEIEAKREDEAADRLNEEVLVVVEEAEADEEETETGNASEVEEAEEVEEVSFEGGTDTEEDSVSNSCGLAVGGPLLRGLGGEWRRRLGG